MQLVETPLAVTGLRMSGPLFSKASDDWRTPTLLYQALHREFGFTLDPAATDENHLCDTYFTASQDGLKQSWKGHSVYVNPPYSQSSEWLRKAADAMFGPDRPALVACLVAARTDTRVWHEVIMQRATEIRLIKGRVRFLLPNGEEGASAPFPSAVVVFTGQLPVRFSSWSYK